MPTTINVRVSEKEKNKAEKLAKYLHKLGLIEKATLSDAMRKSLQFTINEVVKSIERERYSG